MERVTPADNAFPTERPDLPTTDDLSALAEALQRRERFEDADRAYQIALSSAPDDARLLGNHAGLLNELCRFKEAEDAGLRAVSLDPQGWGAWSNLGNTMVEMQRYDDAIAAFSNCLRIKSDHVPALSNLGVALQARGDTVRAVRFLELATGLEPGNADIRCNLAQALLASGDYRRGFAEYEWRWRTRSMPAASLPMRLWRGEDFAGRTLLLHEEGGFGDTLQFVRFAAAAKARGGRVVLQVRRELASVLSRLSCLDEVFVTGAALPDADLHCPLLSLPSVLDTTLQTVPSAEGYLQADDHRLAAWRDRLSADGSGPFRVGLVWAGSPRHGFRGAALADQRRSTTLSAFGAFGSASASFYSLQVGEASAQAASPPPGLRLIDHTSLLRTFDDTAALIACLDLVIAVDTSTAHLAGALGRPVWMLSRYDQCWRWLAGRDDTPWYDTMRLYRQPAPGDWASPIGRAAADLARLAGRSFGSMRIDDADHRGGDRHGEVSRHAGFAPAVAA